MVTFLESDKFALILNQPSMAQRTAKCYERIDDRAHLKSHTKSVRFLDVPASMSLCASAAAQPKSVPLTLAVSSRLLKVISTRHTRVARLQSII